MLIVDTGVIVAATDRTDRHHHGCADLLNSESGLLVTTSLVIAECAYLIERELGPAVEATLYQAIIGGSLAIENLVGDDWVRIHELVTGYGDLPLGGTDASVIAIAERLGQTRVATLDRKHFSVVRPKHCSGFELVPPPTAF